MGMFMGEGTPVLLQTITAFEGRGLLEPQALGLSYRAARPLRRHVVLPRRQHRLRAGQYLDHPQRRVAALLPGGRRQRRCTSRWPLSRSTRPACCWRSGPPARAAACSSLISATWKSRARDEGWHAFATTCNGYQRRRCSAARPGDQTLAHDQPAARVAGGRALALLDDRADPERHALPEHRQPHLLPAADHAAVGSLQPDDIRVRYLPGASTDRLSLVWTAEGWAQFLAEHPQFAARQRDLIAQHAAAPILALRYATRRCCGPPSSCCRWPRCPRSRRPPWRTPPPSC